MNNLTCFSSLRITPPPRGRRSGLLARVVALILLTLAFGAGCQNSTHHAAGNTSKTDAENNEAIVLREGDTVKISFPGAANLDTVQAIRRDGRIGLPIVGEVQAVGMTPAQLSQELVKLYAPQLVYKEVNVTVLSSNFAVFVSGAVLRPGKIVTDRPLTALEAIMEAGGFDSAKANPRAIVIIRDGKALPQRLDLKRVLEGKQVAPFYLKPSDIVHVPDRLVLF